MTAVPTRTASPKDFLSILDLSATDLEALLARAADMKAQRRQRLPSPAMLAGQHVALLFEKPSLRTRSTFEIAVRELGGHALVLPPDSADGVREPLADIARNLERWVRALVVRTFAQEKVAELASAAPNLHVVNALTDEEHPCQALADMLTLRERWGECRGRTLAFIGDGNNVAASLVHAAPMLGISVRLAAPQGYDVPERVVREGTSIARHGAQVTRLNDPMQAAAGADAVYTDVWTSMGAEQDAARRKGAFAGFQVTTEIMRRAAPDACFMHCLPAHRGEEVSAAVIESPASLVFEQAENRLHAQKALLAMLLGH